MGRIDDIAADWEASLAALAWQVEMGIDEVMGEMPIDRFALAEEMRAQAAVAVPSAPARARAAPEVPSTPAVDPLEAAVAEARRAAAAAADLGALREAILAYGHCELKLGAKNTVFADGNPKARVMIVGEAPGRNEDLEGLPFVGEAGQLLDRMFQAIGLSRASPDAEAALYITNVMPWRPPGNRDPEPEEIAMMRPFLERHIALADPEVIVAMGNTPLAALTGKRGILAARGHWGQAFGRPLMPMTHPSYLLRTPAAKREAWADLLALKARLLGLGG